MRSGTYLSTNDQPRRLKVRRYERMLVGGSFPVPMKVYCQQSVAVGRQGDLVKIWARAKARHPMQRVGSTMPAAAIICWAQTAIFMGNGK